MQYVAQGSIKSFSLNAVLTRLAQTVYDWQSRAESRHRLADLPDHLLKDMGISRADAMAEARKPFWRV